MRFRLFTVFLTIACLSAYAQKGALKTAEKWSKRAREQLLLHQEDKAAKYFLRSIRAAPHTPEGYIALADLYHRQQKDAKAAELYHTGYTRCPECRDVLTLPYATSLLYIGNLERAEELLRDWEIPEDAPQSLRQKVAILKKNIEYSKYARHRPPTDTPQNMGPRINTVYADFFPSVSRDDSSLVFTSATNGIDQDFYRAHRDSCGGWFQATAMGTPPNSLQQEGAQMISVNGHYMFFMRCGNRSINGWAAGGCDLYFSYTTKEAWAQPEPFGATINTPAFEGMPALSSDNRTLYFVSDRAGGQGGLDIWYSRFKDGLWQIPQNLGPPVNTPQDETAPWIAPDNRTLYFTSNGHPGLGNRDLFLSRKQPNGRWSRPQNLGYPLNSPYDDVSFCLGANGQKAYFASDRPGGLGGMDLYEVNLDSLSRPDPYTFIYGVVKDSLTGARLPYAQIECSDPNTGALQYHFQSNRGNGSYLEALALNREIALHVYRVGYLDYYDTLTFTQQFADPPDTLNFALLPSYYQPPLTDTLLFRYFFAKNNTTIDDSARTRIKKIVTPYLQQPHVSFFVNGFTDNSGTERLNEKVSFARARALGNLLFNLGIPDEKIHIQGWADAQPLLPNDTKEHRQKNRRVELIVRMPVTH